jgi:endonuclease/exonuclease/phosphatase family metal-dependent hydrolase
VRVATFNLLHGRSLTDGLIDLPRQESACASIGSDVLGLQEVDRDQERSDGADMTAAIARAMDVEHWRFEPALIGTPGAAWRPAAAEDYVLGVGQSGYGVALVSRYPVSRWEVIRLPVSQVRSPLVVPGTRKVVWLRDEPRVALCARVETPLGGMTIATTHLSFVPGVNVRQLRTVVREVRRLLPPPYILAGDLNLIGAIPRVVSGWRSLGSAKTYPSAKPVVQFDWLLARGELPDVARVEALALPVSDHRALAADLG